MDRNSSSFMKDEKKIPCWPETAIGLIGNTRLVALDRVHPGPGRIWAKTEFLQPGGSIKDRPALAIVVGALKDGRLVPQRTVVTMTSGNFGAGLAVVCSVLGHPFVATMSSGNSPQRARMLEALGAEVVLVPQVDGSPGLVTGTDLAAAERAATGLARERSAFYVDQFREPDAIRAHEEGTGPELWDQLEGRLDGFVACVGSGSTFVGVSRFLKRQRPDILCVAVEPEGAEVLAGKPLIKPRHKLQGTSYGTVPPSWDSKLMDLSVAVSDEEAEKWRKSLARSEGLHVGYTSAANVCAAAKVLNSGRLSANAVIGTVLCDTGLKY